MMCDMDIQGEEGFAAGKTTVRGVVHGIEWGLGEIRDHGGTELERVAEEFDHGVFFGRRERNLSDQRKIGSWRSRCATTVGRSPWIRGGGASRTGRPAWPLARRPIDH